jgi:hypothetical protein
MMIDEYDDISLIQIALSLNLIILLTLHAKGLLLLSLNQSVISSLEL